MNITVDASSKYQDSLPISSDTIIEMLDNLGITYTRSDHVPLRTLGKFKGIFWSAENKTNVSNEKWSYVCWWSNFSKLLTFPDRWLS